MKKYFIVGLLISGFFIQNHASNPEDAMDFETNKNQNNYGIPSAVIDLAPGYGIQPSQHLTYFQQQETFKRALATLLHPKNPFKRVKENPEQETTWIDRGNGDIFLTLKKGRFEATFPSNHSLYSEITKPLIALSRDPDGEHCTVTAFSIEQFNKAAHQALLDHVKANVGEKSVVAVIYAGITESWLKKVAVNGVTFTLNRQPYRI